MNIKEQLEQWIEQRANDAGAMASTSPRDKFDIAKLSYKAGANEMKELLLIAVGMLEAAAEKESKDYSTQECIDGAADALKRIQEKIKGE